MLVIADDVQKPEGQNAFTRPIATCLAAIGLLALVLPVKPSFAQAGGYVRVKIVKAGLLASGGIGNGVLTYRGRSYPFRGRFISSRNPMRVQANFRRHFKLIWAVQSFRKKCFA
jgi:hypothetical protein